MVDDIQFGYAGAWAPRGGRTITPNQGTFSLGVFPWVAVNGNPHAKKRGKVLFRVVGDAADPKRAEDLAKRIVAALNDGRINAGDIVQKRFDARSRAYEGWLV